MDEHEMRSRFAAGRVAHLATASATGAPHVVPCVFAAAGDVVYTAVDDKPKRSRDLRRLRNIVENDAVSLLVDAYDEDWTALWWVRADGRAIVVGEGPEFASAVSLLTKKYRQYRERRIAGPVVRIDVSRWSGWSGGARA